MAAPPVAELILYACPHGQLADAIEHYRDEARRCCGANTAHDFPLHVTLTGFFHDSIWSVRDHVDTVAGVLAAGVAPSRRPRVVVGSHVLRRDMHFLPVSSPWMRAVAVAFRDATAESPTRRDEIRPKRDLHISLAYGFPPAAHRTLARLARDLVEPSLPCEWTIGLMERLPNGAWVPQGVWPCPATAD